MLSVEATAAPASPQPRCTIISQSSTILATAAITLHHMARRGLPSNRITNSSRAYHTPNNSPGMKPSIYSRTRGSSASDEPSSLPVAEGKSITGMIIAKMTIEVNIHACITLMRAAFSFFSAMCIDATTEQPAPIISPRPVASIIMGTQILMAPMPSAPTACPTKMPSMAHMAEMLSIPNNVGRK